MKRTWAATLQSQGLDNVAHHVQLVAGWCHLRLEELGIRARDVNQHLDTCHAHVTHMSACRIDSAALCVSETACM